MEEEKEIHLMTEEVVETKELPLATIVINEYKDYNKTLKESNKRLTTNNRILSIIIVILLVLFAVETTYIVIYWDTLHPHAGAIKVNNSE